MELKQACVACMFSFPLSDHMMFTRKQGLPTSILADLRSRIFGTFLVKFLACLPLLGFSNI